MLQEYPGGSISSSSSAFPLAVDSHLLQHHQQYHPQQHHHQQQHSRQQQRCSDPREAAAVVVGFSTRFPPLLTEPSMPSDGAIVTPSRTTSGFGASGFLPKIEKVTDSQGTKKNPLLRKPNNNGLSDQDLSTALNKRDTHGVFGANMTAPLFSVKACPRYEKRPVPSLNVRPSFETLFPDVGHLLKTQMKKDRRTGKTTTTTTLEKSASSTPFASPSSTLSSSTSNCFHLKTPSFRIPSFTSSLLRDDPERFTTSHSTLHKDSTTTVTAAGKTGKSTTSTSSSDSSSSFNASPLTTSKDSPSKTRPSDSSSSNNNNNNNNKDSPSKTDPSDFSSASTASPMTTSKSKPRPSGSSTARGRRRNSNVSSAVAALPRRPKQEPEASSRTSSSRKGVRSRRNKKRKPQLQQQLQHQQQKHQQQKQLQQQHHKQDQPLQLQHQQQQRRQREIRDDTVNTKKKETDVSRVGNRGGLKSLDPRRLFSSSDHEKNSSSSSSSVVKLLSRKLSGLGIYKNNPSTTTSKNGGEEKRGGNAPTDASTTDGRTDGLTIVGKKGKIETKSGDAMTSTTSWSRKKITHQQQHPLQMQLHQQRQQQQFHSSLDSSSGPVILGKFTSSFSLSASLEAESAAAANEKIGGDLLWPDCNNNEAFHSDSSVIKTILSRDSVKAKSEFDSRLVAASVAASSSPHAAMVTAAKRVEAAASNAKSRGGGGDTRHVKIYLSNKQTCDVRMDGGVVPGAPPATPRDNYAKFVDFIPALSDIRSQRQLKNTLTVLEQKQKAKMERQQVAERDAEAERKKEAAIRLKAAQRREIYQLNQIMEELENENFRRFCRSKGIDVEP